MLVIENGKIMGNIICFVDIPKNSGSNRYNFKRGPVSIKQTKKNQNWSGHKWRNGVIKTETKKLRTSACFEVSCNVDVFALRGCARGDAEASDRWMRGRTAHIRNGTSHLQRLLEVRCSATPRPEQLMVLETTSIAVTSAVA